MAPIGIGYPPPQNDFSLFPVLGALKTKDFKQSALLCGFPLNLCKANPGTFSNFSFELFKTLKVTLKFGVTVIILVIGARSIVYHKLRLHCIQERIMPIQTLPQHVLTLNHSISSALLDDLKQYANLQELLK